MQYCARVGSLQNLNFEIEIATKFKMGLPLTDMHICHNTDCHIAKVETYQQLFLSTTKNCQLLARK